MQSGLLFITDCGERGSRVCQELFRSIQRCSHSHHRPAVEGRFLGAAWRRRRAVPGSLVTSPGRSRSSSGRFRVSKRLRPFQGSLLPGMSNTMGGRSARGMRQAVAASGRAAPIYKLTSGRAAGGGVCAEPDLLLPAIRASL